MGWVRALPQKGRFSIVATELANECWVAQNHSVNYRAVLIESEEGFAAFCPAMPGCLSQGAKEPEVLDNIREAAELWLEAGGIVAAEGGSTREAELLREARAESLPARVHEVSLAVPA